MGLSLLPVFFQRTIRKISVDVLKVLFHHFLQPLPPHLSNGASPASEALFMDSTCHMRTGFPQGAEGVQQSQSGRRVLERHDLSGYQSQGQLRFQCLQKLVPLSRSPRHSTQQPRANPSSRCSWGLSQLWESISSLFNLWYLSIILDLFAETLHFQISSVRPSPRPRQRRSHDRAGSKLVWRWGQGTGKQRDPLNTRPLARAPEMEHLVTLHCLVISLRVTKS